MITTDVLGDYFKLQKKIFKSFGYVEGWRAYPLSDMRHAYWMINKQRDTIQWFDEKKTVGIYTGVFDAKIGEDSFLKANIYVKKDNTMIFCDVGVDGNSVLMIFDNKKEIAWQEPESMLGYGDDYGDE